MDEKEQLRYAIAAQEALRATLGDAIVDVALKALREKLAALEVCVGSAEQTRKQVTVLFADISGFTRMSGVMDAEDVSDMMNHLWERLDAIIAAYGGVVDKHMGDAVLALWGASDTHENDAEQAVRAALDMQIALKRFNAEQGLIEKPLSAEAAAMQAAHGFTSFFLEMRIAVNTGAVLIGVICTTGEFSAIGDPLNVAGRLQKIAPVGGVLISQATYRQVRGVFSVQSLPPQVVKGKVDPIYTYAVLKPKPRAFRMRTRGVEGIETRMIGRDRELAALQHSFQTMLSEAKTQPVIVVGDAGVGKSRLLSEFENWVELLPQNIRYFKGRAIPVTQNSFYGLIRDMFSYRFNILESDQTANVLEKFRAGMADVLPPDQVDLIGHLIGFDFSTSSVVRDLLGDSLFKKHASSCFVDYFRAVTQDPTVLFLEDIHWADASSLELIQHLMQEAPSLRLLIVCLTRPPFFEQYPHWGQSAAAFTRLNVSPLSEQDSRMLVREILQKVDAIPKALGDLIVRGAEGNPFYLEELIKMLIEDGVILRGKKSWNVAMARLRDLKVPSTLSGVLQARLDSLPPAEKAVLQRASVVGRLFWDSAVGDLVADDALDVDAEGVRDLLSSICSRELIFQRERSVFEGTHEFGFKHSILRDVTYETVLLKHRRVYHAQVAHWLEVHAGDRLGEYLGLIARHYELAGDRKQASVYLRRAGQESANVSAFREAMKMFERALKLTPEIPLDLVKTLEMCAQERILLLLNLGVVGRSIGAYESAVMHLQEGLALARACDDQISLALILFNLGDIAYRQWDALGAEIYAQESLQISQTIEDRLGVANALKVLGMAAFIRERYAHANQLFEQSSLLYKEIEQWRGEGACLINLGETARKQMLYTKALRYYQQSLEIYKVHVYRFGKAFCYNNIGHVHLKLGNDKTAWQYLCLALRETLFIGATPVSLETLLGVAWLRVKAGYYELAAELLGLVMTHPTFNAEIKAYALPLRARLREVLTMVQLDAALARGQGCDLYAIAAEILREKCSD